MHASSDTHPRFVAPRADRLFLAELSSNTEAPHRNRVLRAMRIGKKTIAERRQQELFDAADRGEELPDGPVDPSLLLSGLEAATAAGEDRVEQRDKFSLATALLAHKERKEEEKKKKKKGRRRHKKDEA